MTLCPIEKLTFKRKAHSYWVKLFGESSTRYSGASNYGGQIEDTSNLARWLSMQRLKGAHLDPTLHRSLLMAQDRDEEDEILEKLLDVAKANEARDHGKAVHRAIELADTDRLDLTDEWTRGQVENWQRAISAADITLYPHLVERIVINPEMRVCATFDRIARYMNEDTVIDAKTGKDIARYPHKAAVQLAVIAHCPWITVGDGETKRSGDDVAVTWTKFEPAPKVNQKVGLIVAMPIEGTTQVLELDIEAGWEAAQLAWKAKEWGKRRDLVTPLAVAATEAVATDGDWWK